MSTKHLFKNAYNSPIDNRQSPKIVRRPPQSENGFWVSFIVNYHDTATQMNLRNTLLSKRNLTSNSKYWMIHSTYMQLQNRPIYFTGKIRTMVAGERKEEEPPIFLSPSPHTCWREQKAPRASAMLSTQCATHKATSPAQSCISQQGLCYVAVLIFQQI